MMIANRSIPATTVIPELGYVDVNQAADWLCDVFGFTVRLRIANHRIQLNVGDGAVVVTESAGGSSSVMVRIADVDQHYERARERGAEILRMPESYPYGERQYSVRDLGGHRWKFSQSIADVAPEEWGGTGVNL
jgi:uncharacterized glyoxalase superfamily protein PhnB